MPQNIAQKKISFHKTPTGGRGHRFMKLFRKIDFFLKDGFPKVSTLRMVAMRILQLYPENNFLKHGQVQRDIT